ncbi:hypothetical protein N7471_013601 [Penicillium samsonianum]|uniref:uncharacterized protein n=1 Tax=Penicillium samsonianum TaxID=1882272 RepID=UPI002549757A|nr:uncharacterized protein N7471_013601 [Penicillium samsonianum]KAJ6118981.1 hypothetical protein N7471_013601 [Penicillium samsonianum]
MTIEAPQSTLNTINFVTQCLCIPIITVFVALRFAVRIYFNQFVLVEDGMSQPEHPESPPFLSTRMGKFSVFLLNTSTNTPQALFMAYCGIAIEVGNYGAGYHYTVVSPDLQVSFRKWCYIATVVYCPMILFVKYALLSILIRIFSPYRSKILFIYALLGCLTIYYIVAEIVKIRMCDPIPSYWTVDPSGSCLDQRAALIADSVISVVTDGIILVLPLPLTWSLQMSRNKKLRVVGILSAGGLATAFSIYRLVLVLRDGSSMNMTVVFTCVILSGNAEGGMGLICACLPTLNILISRLCKAGYSYGSKKHYTHDSSMQLSKMKGNDSRNISTNKSRSSKSEFVPASDQSHLISYADIANIGSSNDGYIHKTIDVSQYVEIIDRPEKTYRPV